MEVDRNGLEVLDRVECLRLLSTATLGRVGFTSGALPTVMPVNFHLEGTRILVRTDRGSRFHTALKNAVVAFEVDDFDRIGHGWGVSVTGRATDVSRAPANGEALLAISTEFVSGRRMTSPSQALQW
jgi:nitroimidazol reductase NimA-like FMN-containing flavoprotein (pyridoxamine 5'-phosphate oxidase superfamily)